MRARRGEIRSHRQSSASAVLDRPSQPVAELRTSLAPTWKPWEEGAADGSEFCATGTASVFRATRRIHECGALARVALAPA